MTEETVHHHFIDRVAVIAGIASGVALYPQVVSVILNHSTEGLSITSFFIICINSIVWSLYAVHRKITALVISSVLNTIASLILIFALMY